MNLSLNRFIMSHTRVVLFTHGLILLKGYVIMLKKALVYTSCYYVKHLCCFVQKVSYYVKWLCYYVKKSGYLVYEASEVCKCVIMLNAWFVMSTHCLILLKGYAVMLKVGLSCL